MADPIDRTNDIEGRIEEAEIERIRERDAERGLLSNGPARPGEPRTQAEIDQWIKAQTSIRPRKPLPKP
jgi:hypothetical protein